MHEREFFCSFFETLQMHQIFVFSSSPTQDRIITKLEKNHLPNDTNKKKMFLTKNLSSVNIKRSSTAYEQILRSIYFVFQMSVVCGSLMRHLLIDCHILPIKLVNCSIYIQFFALQIGFSFISYGATNVLSD